MRSPKSIDGRAVHPAGVPREYKLSILAEYDRCSESGDKGALLRREGLYSSIITDWRRQHREGHPRGERRPRLRRRPQVPDRAEIDKLRAENERLKTKLAKAEAIIEVQGKVQALLEELSKSADTDDT